MSEKEKSVFQKLYDVDATDRMMQKQNLSYLPWATAYSEVMKEFPEMTYEIVKYGDEQIPYLNTPLGLMVTTRVTIDGITREMCLPVMDSNNKAMKEVEYTYKVKHYENKKWDGTYDEKPVEKATMFDINKSIMRCLAKNLAMFGLGLHLWTKEELPESILEADKLRKEIDDIATKKCALSEEAKAKVGQLCKEADKEANGNYRLIEDVDVLKSLKKSLLGVRQ